MKKMREKLFPNPKILLLTRNQVQGGYKRKLNKRKKTNKKRKTNRRRRKTNRIRN
jgi:hypothetical protein